MKTRQTKTYITETERRIPVVGEGDVIVAGGGPAGMAAALAAARCGAHVQILETHGCLGGIWTAGLLTWMFEMNQPGIPREISQRLDQRAGKSGDVHGMYSYDPESMKLLLEDMCAEANVRFQLHTRVVGVLRDGNRLSGLLTESKSGREAWRAACFVDATGDGDLAALAGCGYDMGREPSGECQPMTYMALVTVLDAEPVIHCVSGGDLSNHLKAVGNFLAEIRRAGIEPSYARPTLFQVRGNLLALMVNHEYGVPAMDAAEVTRATVRGRKEVNAVVQSLRNLGGPWRGMNLVATCEQIGVREGRRIHGRYTVTQDDLAAGRRHEDAVCRVSFGIDVHCTNPASGKGQESSPHRMKAYDIPMRALVAKDVSNLLLAGRCLSGDFIAHSSYRVTGTAASTGQAAGAAAALAAREGQSPAEIPWPDIVEALHKAVQFEQVGSGDSRGRSPSI